MNPSTRPDSSPTRPETSSLVPPFVGGRGGREQPNNTPASSRAIAIARRAGELITDAELEHDSPRRPATLAAHVDHLLKHHTPDLERLASYWPALARAGVDPIEDLAWRAQSGRWHDTPEPPTTTTTATEPRTFADYALIGRRNLRALFANREPSPWAIRRDQRITVNRDPRHR